MKPDSPVEPDIFPFAANGAAVQFEWARKAWTVVPIRVRPSSDRLHASSFYIVSPKKLVHETDARRLLTLATGADFTDENINAFMLARLLERAGKRDASIDLEYYLDAARGTIRPNR